MAKKTVELHIRITPEIYDCLQKKAAACAEKNVSAYIRNLILSQEIQTNPFVKMELAKLRHETNKIGVNINQIVKDYNSGFYSDDEKQSLQTKLDHLILQFESIRKEIIK